MILSPLDKRRSIGLTEAARVLGMQRPNLYRKVRQLAVTRKGPTPVSVEEDSLEIH